jgi:hypothetical protein
MLYFQCSVKRHHMLKEQELIYKIERQLPNIIPSSLEVGSFRSEVNVGNNMEVDILTTLYGPNSSTPINFAIEVKYTNRLSNLLQAAYQAKKYAEQIDALPMVASTFIGERTRELLKMENVNYLDLAGNLYVNIPKLNLYLERIVNKNPFTNTPPLKNIFAAKSSRLARAMLNEPRRSWSMSELSKETELSIGQTFNVLEAMGSEQLAQKKDDNLWSLTDPTALLEAWQKVYPTYKSRKYTFYSYSSNMLSSQVREVAERKQLPYALGFFSGADMVAPYIRGINKVQFYTDQLSVEKWRDALELKEVGNGGNVEIYVPYDKGVLYGVQMLPPGVGDTPVVSNIQLYMDLFNNPARGEEAATHIREEKLGY